MKKLVLVILSAAILLAIFISPITVAASGTVYYISASGGNDNNSGTTSDKPWKSFVKINRTILKPGDKVLLKRGDIWSQRLEIYGSGTASAWISIGAYGDSVLPKPKIELSKGPDDIAVLVQDLIWKEPYICPVGYLNIDSLDIRNTRMGIYFRQTLTRNAKGLSITNCDFSNIICESVMEKLQIKDRYPDYVGNELAAVKGNLPYYDNKYHATGGGMNEYVFPAAILVGGRSSGVTDNPPPMLSDITVKGCVFENSATGIMSWLYLYNAGGYKQSTKNWRIEDCVQTGSINGMIALDSVDGGYTGNDNGWGVVKNCRVIAGSDRFGFRDGTTGAIVQSSKNMIFNFCDFSGIQNNGYGDGCGFDFEGNNEDIILQNSVFSNNEGEAMLISSTVAPQQNLTVRNNMFINNLTSPALNIYTSELALFTGNGRNIAVQDNYAFSRYETPFGKYISFIGGDGRFIGLVAARNRQLRIDRIDGETNEFRGRWAFNKDGDNEGWEGSAQGGYLKFSGSRLAGKSIYFNAVTYRKLAVCYRKNGSTKQVRMFDVPEKAVISSIVLDFGESANYEIDYIQPVTNASLSVNVIRENEMLIGIKGAQTAMLLQEINPKAVQVTGLPQGVTLTNVRRINYNTLDLTFSGKVWSGKDGNLLQVAINASQFVKAFSYEADGLDMTGRTATEEQSLFGYDKAQTFYYNGTMSQSFRVKGIGYAQLPNSSTPSSRNTSNTIPSSRNSSSNTVSNSSSGATSSSAPSLNAITSKNTGVAVNYQGGYITVLDGFTLGALISALSVPNGYSYYITDEHDKKTSDNKALVSDRYTVHLLYGSAEIRTYLIKMARNMEKVSRNGTTGKEHPPFMTEDELNLLLFVIIISVLAGITVLFVFARLKAKGRIFKNK